MSKLNPESLELTGQGSRPGSPASGEVIYNSGNGYIEAYGSAGWNPVINVDTLGGSASTAAKSGKQLADSGGYSSGNYYIKPDGYGGSAIQAYVDMTTNGGGWVLCGAFARSHSNYTMSGTTSGSNESGVKSYATTIPSNNANQVYNRNFINYLCHQNSSAGTYSDYSIMGVHGKQGDGYILWEVKAKSSYRNNSLDMYHWVYDTEEVNNKADVRYVTNSSNTLNHYVGTSSSSFNSWANYNDGRTGCSDGGNCYHYLIDDITGGYEWLFRENNDDSPANNVGYDLSVFFIR